MLLNLISQMENINKCSSPSSSPLRFFPSLSLVYITNGRPCFTALNNFHFFLSSDFKRLRATISSCEFKVFML